MPEQHGNITIGPMTDPMLGQVIRGYVIRNKLAEGGMGAVYVATHERLETRKVIKILLPIYARHPMLRDRFEREALAVSRLRHKHIVTIDDYGQLPDGQLFLMMPFLDGRPLDVYLAEHRQFTEHRTLHIIVQVCSALQHMHDARIVHRDIKPSNIFIVKDDDNPYRVVLLDLGIAKSLSERDLVTHAGARMGTPAYMAVEQHEDAANVTPLADVYAVAVVAWEMVAGAMPWGTHTTSSEVLYTLKKQKPPRRPSWMSEAWYAILASALSAHPGDRPQSMRALAVALASAVPAIPPHVPSGAEILTQLARTFVQHAPPDDETVRSGAKHDLAPMLWPPTNTRGPASDGLPPLSGDTAPSQHAPHAVSGITATPAGTRQLPPPTTLTESVGVAIPRTARRKGASFALALASAVLAAVAVYGLTRGETGRVAPASSSTQPALSPDAPSLEAPTTVTPTAAVDAGAVDVDAASEGSATEAPPAHAERSRPSVKTPPGAAKKSSAQPSSSATDRAAAPSRGSSTKFDPNAVGGGDE